MTILSDRFRGLRKIPHIPLAELPTAVEPLERLSQRAGAEIWIKRDDRTSPRYGGNKVRKLEYVLGEVRKGEADTIVTAGAAGSHHVVACGLFGGEQGLKVHAVMTPQRFTSHVEENLRASLALGVEVHPAPSAPRALATLARVTASLRLRGRRPFVVPPGGSDLAGIVGYVEAGIELARQLEAGVCPEPDAIFVALGSGGDGEGRRRARGPGSLHAARARHADDRPHRRAPAPARRALPRGRIDRPRPARDRRGRARRRLRRADGRRRERVALDARARRPRARRDIHRQGLRRPPASRERLSALRVQLESVREERNELDQQMRELAARPVAAPRRAGFVVASLASTSLLAAIVATFLAWPSPPPVVAPSREPMIAAVEPERIAEPAVEPAVTELAPPVVAAAEPVARPARPTRPRPQVTTPPATRERDLLHGLDEEGDEVLSDSFLNGIDEGVRCPRGRRCR